MKKYCHVYNNVVTEIIPEFDSMFPDIPIEKRYSKEFLDNCVVVDESVNVRTGMIYINGEFVDAPVIEIPEEPVIPIEPTPDEIELLELKIAQNTAETLEALTSLNEMQKIEQAQSNAEMIELILSLQGGM